MAESTVPNLAEFVARSRRGKSGPCMYVRSTTPAQRAEIRAFVEQGERRWVAFSKWLEAQGVAPLPSHGVSEHFNRGHADDE